MTRFAGPSPGPRVAARSRLDLLDPFEVSRLGGIEVITEGVVEGFLTGLHRSPRRGFSVEFAEHRMYQPGDELRYVDWKILGRNDRLYVKQFEEETNLRAMVVFDASRSMAWTGAPETVLPKLAYAQRLVAALRWFSSASATPSGSWPSTTTSAPSFRRGPGSATGASWCRPWRR